jgi:outer membrane protein assembly factor BamB
MSINSGRTIWAHHGVTSQVVPCLDSSLLFYAHGSIIYAVDKWTGQKLWSNDAISTGSFTTMSVDDERLYIGNRTFVTALNKTNGAVIWTIGTPDINSIQDWPSGFCVTDQHIFIKDFLPGPPETNGFVVVNKVSGVIENSWTVDYMNYASPTIAGQHFIDGNGGNLYFYNYQTGNLDYTLNTSNSITQPIIANGMVFIGSYGNVKAFKPKSTSTEENIISTSCDIYPNPGQDICMMETGEETSKGVLEVLDISGKVLLTQIEIPNDGEVEFDIKKLKPGMYIVKFTAEGRIQTGTLMKK